MRYVSILIFLLISSNCTTQVVLAFTYDESCTLVKRYMYAIRDDRQRALRELRREAIEIGANTLLLGESALLEFDQHYRRLQQEHLPEGSRFIEEPMPFGVIVPEDKLVVFAVGLDCNDQQK